MKTIIETASKQYPLIVGKGVLSQLPDVIASLQPKVTKVLIITDDAVASFHLQKLLDVVGEHVPVHIVPHGEKEKNMVNYEKCLTTAIEIGLDRHSLILALGGGMIGDLAGFVAASYMRGIRFIQIPTTLLAHDSAVGGKVAINHPLGKNLIGAFHQPEAVLYDIDLLQTLNDTEWRSGFAELLKHGYLEGADFVGWISTNLPTIEAVKTDRLEEGLVRGIHVKARIVKMDEKENSVRAYLNFGHTLGHAIESLAGYGKMTHGDCVAIGMRFAFLVSECYYNKSFDINDIQKRMDTYGYPRMPKIPIDDLINSMKKDKKSMNEVIRMVLIKGYGQMAVEEVDTSLIKECLQRFVIMEQEG
ncbi:MAG: 3-dehydroquinate synthase [Bacillaceae bacterium]